MQDWSAIQQLAQEYVDIREQGYGATVKDRTPRQSAIVDEVIMRTTAFLTMLARKATREGVQQATTYGSRNMRVDATIEIDDLVQEGAIHIHTNFGQYDPQRGSISTFLRANALVGMSRLNRQHALIRVPRELSGLDTIMQTAEESLDASPRRPPQPRYVELDAPASRDETESGMRRIDMLVDPAWRAPYDAFEDRQSVEPALRTLSEKYRDVIERRYGLNGHEPTDANVLAREMGVSRERIRQIETKALSQMRHDTTKRATGEKRAARK